MGSFENKVVLITGASSGIGAEMAREFARQGADVVLTARRKERLESLAKDIRSMGRKALPVQCDVTQDGDMERAVETTHAELGPLDVVVANAGFGVAGNVDSLTIDDFRRQNETNFYGVLRTIYATLPDLKQTKGRLAVVGSAAGYVSSPGSVPYSISKFAVRALCEGLVHELKHEGVSVTLISPGFVASEIRQVDNQGTYHEDKKDFAPSWIVMPTDKAARQMVRGIAKRKREQIITFHARVFIWLRHWTPWLLNILLGKAGKPRKKPSEKASK